MNDEDQYPELTPILNRIAEARGKYIGVGPGWHSILIDLDKALAEVDPAYVVHQIKQECGELDVRVDTAHSDRYQEMRALIRDAERRASHICEACGAAGVLHVSRDGNVCRLCGQCAAAAQEGYEAVSSDLETRASLHRVAMQAAALHRTLRSLPPDANRRITGGDLDAVSQLASRALWCSTSDLYERGEHDYAAQVVEHARAMEPEGISKLRLITNSLAISERFWRAIYPDAAVERDGGGLRITPPAGPALLFIEALAAHLITTVDMELAVDAGAADRLREAGFDVSSDGRYVVDVNATESTVRMEVRP
ncbi:MULTISPECIES: hypothetical protein [Tsukamurella]|uniref:Uncharacterized protein n=2 Tax=Tsukamurella TaxID=2060 RepID=A0A5C5RZT7_9ACTN|nr:MULTISPECIES: hypothetical protein [Tsukamurella]NMD56557.1 hypothetical protein [Tsukamurella columbiensis]TWS27511.1 hypothetical protein FK530_18515 [Tsukamurella conjunctivitidis]